MCIRDRRTRMAVSSAYRTMRQPVPVSLARRQRCPGRNRPKRECTFPHSCLLYTSDAAEQRSSGDLGGRRIIKKKQQNNEHMKR